MERKFGKLRRKVGNEVYETVPFITSQDIFTSETGTKYDGQSLNAVIGGLLNGLLEDRIVQGEGKHSIVMNDITNNTARGENSISSGVSSTLYNETILPETIYWEPIDDTIYETVDNVTCYDWGNIKFTSAETTYGAVETIYKYYEKHDFYRYTLFQNYAPDLKSGYTVEACSVDDPIWMAIKIEILKGEGTLFNLANGITSFVGGIDNVAMDDADVALGNNNLTSGKFSLTIGRDNITRGEASANIGIKNYVTGAGCVAIGRENVAGGEHSIAFGANCKAIGKYASAFGAKSVATDAQSTAFGENNKCYGGAAFVCGKLNTVKAATGNVSFVCGENNTSEGRACAVFNLGNVTKGAYSAAFGGNNVVEAQGSYTLVGGQSNTVSGNSCLVSGLRNVVSDNSCLVGGQNNTVSGNNCLVSGLSNTVSGSRILCFGQENSYTHEFGDGGIIGNQNIAGGQYNFIIGFGNESTSDVSQQYMFGKYLKTTGYEQVAVGAYNAEDANARFIVGNGTSDVRSNALVVKKTGDVEIAGGITANGSITTNSIILNSSTEGSQKKFRITVDDEGNLSAEEV